VIWSGRDSSIEAAKKVIGISSIRQACEQRFPAKRATMCPGIVGPCFHGDKESDVYVKLCQIVDEWVEIYGKDGKPLPPATAGQGFVAKIA
jgi:hypothetical protein